MKIGIDYNEVISKFPEFFKIITKALIKKCHEVHIITGERFESTKFFFEKHNIRYTHFFSITDTLLKAREPYTIDENNRPCFDLLKWDNAKAKYCKEHNIDFMLDDSDIYGSFFTTPYIKFKVT